MNFLSPLPLPPEYADYSHVPTHPVHVVLGINPGALCMLGLHYQPGYIPSLPLVSSYSLHGLEEGKTPSSGGRVPSSSQSLSPSLLIGSEANTWFLLSQ